MEVLDVSVLEGRLKSLGIIEPALRMSNSGIWLCYWLFAPFPVFFAVIGVWSFAVATFSWPGISFIEDAEVAYERSAFELCLFALYLATNLAVLSYRRRWAIAALALSGIVVATTSAELARFGPSVFRLDPFVFWVGLASWLVTNGLVVFLMVALASLFSLSRAQRELLCPMSSPKVFPRRRFRSMTVLPDVIDFVRDGRARIWISIQYITAAGLFLMLPYQLLRSYGVFMEAINQAGMVCSEHQGETLRACMVQYMYASIPIYALLGLAISLFGWLMAQRLLTRAQRRLTFSLEEVTRVDSRPPVLFLRSFADDQVSLRQTEMSLLHRIVRGRQSASPFEHVLVQRLTTIGPVVALGRPTDTQQPYGAARTYLPSDNWHGEVIRLLALASYVVIVLDDSEGLLWELEQVAAGNHYSKCIFLVHPRFSARDDNLALLRHLESRSVVPAELVHAAINRFRVPVLGWFDLEGAGAGVCLSETFSGRSLELLLRWFEKVVARRCS
jgi:hypothetical protein